MADRLFGTDGIRGRANREPMTAATALNVAMAVGTRFHGGDRRHLAVIGKDTRLSGYMLESALTAGLVAVGMDVALVGPLPTPAIAMLTRSLRADLGIMISASHNPFEDNGIKLFGPDGYKISDAMEAELTVAVQENLPPTLASSAKLGKARRLDDAAGRYIEFVKGSFPRGLSLAGLKIVVDCANGAAYKVAPTVLWELGAEVVPVAVHPDGMNINLNCGATSVGMLASQVVTHGAHLGLALDGDADRLIVIDEHGAVVDGDQIMALIATSWARAGRLTGGGVVATVMSNLGMEQHLAKQGLSLVRTKVGDRHVLEEMRRGGYNVGGEQSGHIILTDYSTTGDGLVAALQFLACVVETGSEASKVARVFEPLPQMLKSVRYERGGADPLGDDRVIRAIAATERDLVGRGRLLIRKSGTEPVIRVMAEAGDPDMVTRVVEDLAEIIAQVAASD